MIEVTKDNVVQVAEGLKSGVIPGAARSLAEAMCRVMENVSYVQKDKQMQGGGSYRYVSVEAVIEKLRPEMIRQQLVLLPVGVEPLTIETFEGKNGGRQNRTQVKYTFKLLHAASGQSEPVVVIGEAIDVGDKSSNKAMTAARKYALVMAFNIETGTDPDDVPSEKQERAAAPVPAAKPVADNPGRRAALAMKLGGCKTEPEFKSICDLIVSDRERGLLSAADCAALKDVAKATLAGLKQPA